MSAQAPLPLPSSADPNIVVINARCTLRIETDRRVIVVAGLAVHHYRAEDAVAEIYAMVFLVEAGFAQQAEVARAFARSVRPASACCSLCRLSLRAGCSASRTSSMAVSVQRSTGCARRC